MRMLSRRRTAGYAAAFFISLGAIVAASSRGESASLDALDALDDSVAHMPPPPPTGRSGKLLARFVIATDDQPAGVYASDEPSGPQSYIAMHPFAEKQGAKLGAYRVGFWPGERMEVGSAYANPLGFIEVTRANENTRVSEHFRLRDFLTHDQRAVWPKYLVLREDLVDKLELVIDELEREGHPVKRMTVMSGFRTPQYNASGGITSGRAKLSRHMYGDASDVFVDNDGDGRMDDLNGDGVIDFRDAQVILHAEEQVEAAHRDLIGGGGVYKATHEHGPFAHIDVRGHRARWGLVE